MQCMFFDLLPSPRLCPRCTGVWLLLLLLGDLPPDDDFPVIRRAGEDAAKLWVSPAHAPHGSVVSSQRVEQGVAPAALVDFKQLHRTIRRAGRKTFPVKVELDIVHHILVLGLYLL